MLLAASGCATFTNADVAAQVGDSDITTDDFGALAEEYFANPDVFGTAAPLDGRVSGEQSRLLLGAMARQEIVNQFLAQQGIDASGIQQAFKDSALAATPIEGMSDAMQDLIASIDDAPRSEAVTLAETPTIDQLRALYADNPTKTGLVCVRHILVDTEAEAQSVLDELRNGADFASLAIERSIDPTAADLGGAISNVDNQCIPLQTVLASFDPAFVAGALAAREGVPSEPVESSFGWHIILHRPWDEVAESVGQIHQPGDSGAFLFDGFAATVEVNVDARFGTWNPISGAIAPVG